MRATHATKESVFDGARFLQLISLDKAMQIHPIHLCLVSSPADVPFRPFKERREVASLEK